MANKEELSVQFVVLAPNEERSFEKRYWMYHLTITPTKRRVKLSRKKRLETVAIEMDKCEHCGYPTVSGICIARCPKTIGPGSPIIARNPIIKFDRPEKYKRKPKYEAS